MEKPMLKEACHPVQAIKILSVFVQLCGTSCGTSLFNSVIMIFFPSTPDPPQHTHSYIITCFDSVAWGNLALVCFHRVYSNINMNMNKYIQWNRGNSTMV